jgi:hypothetical protein
MKSYKTFNESLISETKELIIHNIPYYDIINICELNNLKIDKSFKDQWEMGYCDYIKIFKKNEKKFSDLNYQFLIGIRNEELVSLFYKIVGTDRNKYGDGYIVSSQKGNANEMFLEMKKHGHYTTYSNLENIASIKSQLKINAEIITLSTTAPDKDGNFSNNIDEKILELIKKEKIYFKDTYNNREFFFMNKKHEIDIRKLDQFLLNNSDVKLIFPKDTFKENPNTKEIETGLKLYFYH